MPKSILLTVMGVDPGLANTGVAVASVDTDKLTIGKVEHLGLLSTRKCNLLTVRKSSDFLARAQQQSFALQALAKKYNPHLISCEMTTTTPYTYPTFSFGVMMGIVATLNLPVIEVLPSEVKKAILGSSSASKADIIAWAMQKTAHQRKITWPTSQRASRLGMMFRGKHVSPSAEHQADALAIINAAILTEQFRLACVMSGLRPS